MACGQGVFPHVPVSSRLLPLYYLPLGLAEDKGIDSCQTYPLSQTASFYLYLLYIQPIIKYILYNLAYCFINLLRSHILRNNLYCCIFVIPVLMTETSDFQCLPGNTYINVYALTLNHTTPLASVCYIITCLTLQFLQFLYAVDKCLRGRNVLQSLLLILLRICSRSVCPVSLAIAQLKRLPSNQVIE